jgi:hypothetical protein
MITLRVSIVFAGVLITIIALVTYALLLLKDVMRAQEEMSRELGYVSRGGSDLRPARSR